MEKFNIFITFFRPFRRYFFTGLLFVFISGIAQIFSYTIVGKLIDFSIHRSTGTWSFSLKDTLLLLFVTVLVQVFASFINQYQFAKMNEYSLAHIRKEMFGRYLRYPIPFFDKERIGNLLSRISVDTAMLQYIFTEQIPTFIYQSIVLLISTGMLFIINWKLTLVMICVLSFTLLLAQVIGNRIKLLSEQIQDMIAASNTHIEEALQKIRTVKVFASEKREIKKYNTFLDKIVVSNIRRTVAKIGLGNLSTLLIFAAQIIILGYGSYLVRQNEISIGNLISFFMITLCVSSAVTTLSGAYGNLQNSIGSTQSLYYLFHEAPEQGYDFQEQPVLQFNEGITFHNVSFSYYGEHSDDYVLNDLNIKIHKGEKVAIIGASGDGKTTILQLLLRFYQPTSGDIRIDGNDISHLPLHDYRRLFGVVSQEIELFGFSIRENICYGNPLITDEMMVHAAKMAKAFEFIRELPNGFDTIIGENGITLSGGQRQRIAIARALAVNPQILILDEATSALDYNTEQLIKKDLNELLETKTCVIITHRLSSIQDIDKIFVLKDGRVAESGKHSDLKDMRDGLYYNLLLRHSDE